MNKEYFKVARGYKENDIISLKEHKLYLELEDGTEIEVGIDNRGTFYLRKAHMIIEPVVSNVIHIK